MLGAGAAGIAAGRHLQNSDKKVIVLEARNRTGGRFWNECNMLSIPHERGASLCHGGPDTSTWPLAMDLGIKGRKFKTTLPKYDMSGPWVHWKTSDFYNFPKSVSEISKKRTITSGTKKQPVILNF